MKYPELFGTMYHGISWICFLLKEVITVQDEGKFKSKIKGKTQSTHTW